MTLWHLARKTGAALDGSLRSVSLGATPNMSRNIIWLVIKTLIWRRRKQVTVYKCHAGPVTLVKDNITESQEHCRSWKIMEGDFYKCGEVAFSQWISSSGATAMFIGQAAVRAKWNFFLSGDQMALLVINPSICTRDIHCIRILGLPKAIHRVVFVDRLKLRSTFQRRDVFFFLRNMRNTVQWCLSYNYVFTTTHTAEPILPCSSCRTPSQKIRNLFYWLWKTV